MFGLEEKRYFTRHESCFQVSAEMSDKNRIWSYARFHNPNEDQ